MLADGARLPDGHVKDAVQLDEILQALDPGTRAAFRSWQQDFGRALADRGDDANDALGNAPGFVDEATQLTDTLDQHSGAVRALSRNTGEVFGALTRREDQLRNLITNTGEVFDATASQQRALAQTIQILPTFLDESRVTLQRVARFSRRTDPLVRDLDPVLRDAVPTLTDLRALAPDLRDFYRRLGPLITASKSGFPAAGETLRKLRPLLAATGPALSELNPILQWLEYNQRLTAGLFNPPVALADTVATQSPQEIGHYLRSLSPAGAESIALWPQRLPTNRGNAYLSPLALASPERARQMIVPSWDCKNTGRGEFTTRKGGTDDAPSCYRAGFPGWENRPGVFPHINRADYTKKGGK
jgi:ABC-type transporter Mla subunit MlaD